MTELEIYSCAISKHLFVRKIPTTKLTEPTTKLTEPTGSFGHIMKYMWIVLISKIEWLY